MSLGITDAVRMAESLRDDLGAEQVAVTLDSRLGPLVLIVGRGGQRAIEAEDGSLVTFDLPE